MIMDFICFGKGVSAKFTSLADISVTHLEAAWDFKDFEDIKSLRRLFG